MIAFGYVFVCTLYLHVHVDNITKIRYIFIQGAVGSCQKPILKPKEDSSLTSLLWAAVVCLLIISAIFFTSYMYIKLRIKPYVDVTQAL